MPDLTTLDDMVPLFRARGNGIAILALGSQTPRAISYGALHDAISVIARGLEARDLPKGSPVGLVGPNGIGWIEAFWGIIAAGYPVAPLDVQASKDDLRGMIETAQCRLVFCAPEQSAMLSEFGVAHVSLDELPGADRSGSEATRERNPIPHRPVRPDETAVLAFTSGTTGTPKAVPLSHANLTSNVSSLLAEMIIGPDDRALVPLPLHHTYALTVGLLTVLAAGATIVLPAGLSGPQLIEALSKGRTTALLGVPRLYAALLASLRSAASRQATWTARLLPHLFAVSDFLQHRLHMPVGRWVFRSLRAQISPSLRLLVSGGAALPPEDEAALTTFGWEVLTGYGLTETSPILAFNRPGHARIGSAGQALPGVRLRIAAPDPDGVGEIEVIGRSVFSGYLGNAAATAKAFTADGWFRTGDIGRIDADGYLHVMARSVETIVLPSGKKVFPEAIEAAYADDPVIRELAVMGSANGLLALVVPNDAALREAGALRLRERVNDALRARGRALPAYLRLVGFEVTRRSLPRTQLGKLRRHMLKPLYEAARRHEPEPGSPHADESALAEPLARAVWQWLHARYPEPAFNLSSSPQLDLGIDSLGWIDLTLALQREFGVALSEQQIARVVTIEDLLREVVAAQASGAPASGTPAGDALPATPGLGERIVRVAGEAVLRASMMAAFRLRVTREGDLPSPPFVICPNHVSYMDAPALAAALPHRILDQTYWAGWTGLLFSSPLRRFLSRAAQIIPVDPDRAAESAIDLGAAVLRSGRCLVWFPEGILSPDGTLQPFQEGIGAVLERQPVPVVPVRIDGTSEALPPGSTLPRLRRITVHFGAPIDPGAIASGLVGRSRQRRIADAIHAAVAALDSSGQTDCSTSRY